MNDKLEEDEQLVHEREILQAFANKEWEERGTIDPMALVYMTRDPQTKEPFEEPYRLAMIATQFDGSEVSKNGFSAYLKLLCADGAAKAIGMVSESYHLRVKALEGETQEQAIKRINALRATQGGSIEGLPGTTEILMLAWEHRAFKGTEVWMAPITREIPGDENSKGTLGPWELQSRDGEDTAQTVGRFTHFLHRSGEENGD